MTKIGVMRERYAKEVEPPPSRFTTEYIEWTVRADAWAEGRE